MSFEALGVVSRWAVFTGLLVAVGAVVFDLWVLRWDRARPAENADAPAFSPAAIAARIAGVAALVLVLGAIGRLAAEVAVFRDPFEPWTSEMRLLVTATSFGTAWSSQLGLGITASLSFFAAARSRRPAGGVTPGWTLAAIATLGLALTPAYSGHAAGSEHYRGLAISADAIHVLSGGAWLGTLAVIAFVVARSRAAGHMFERERLVGWVSRFSPLALAAAAALGVTGVVASWLHLDAVSSLWQTPYGRMLLYKVGVLGVIVGFGLYNWKRSRGKIAVSGDPARLPGSVAAELLAGLAILLVTALLVTTPPPGE